MHEAGPRRTAEDDDLGACPGAARITVASSDQQTPPPAATTIVQSAVDELGRHGMRSVLTCADPAATVCEPNESDPLV